MINNNTNILLESGNKEEQRKYVKVYTDFYDCKNISNAERTVYITLKYFLSYGEDAGMVFPNLDTIIKKSKMSKTTVQKALNGLLVKKIISKKRRGLTKSNVYVLNDNEEMWKAVTVEEMQEKAEEHTKKELLSDYTEEELLQELQRRKEQKEKELSSKTTTELVENSTKKTTNNNTEVVGKSQEKVEFATLKSIQQLYRYDDLVLVYPDHKSDIDMILGLIYKNIYATNNDYINIGKDRKPIEVVKSAMEQLTNEELIFAIEQFHNKKEQIKNHTSYLLTILYNAKEQYYLYLHNKGHINGDF